MSSDGRLISYTAIHLNRREEILIQSIISLYNSKDNYKWIYHEASDDVSAVVIGSEAKSLIDLGDDPFQSIEKRHIVIMLGDLFYPKDARALVCVGLPIKALDLVDKLEYIERNVISRSLATEYVAVKKASVMKNAEPALVKPDVITPVSQDGSFDFFVKKPAVEHKESSLSTNKEEVEALDAKELLGKNKTIEEHAISLVDEKVVEQKDPVEAGLAETLSLTLTDDADVSVTNEVSAALSSNSIEVATVVEETAVEDVDIKWDSFPSINFNFSGTNSSVEDSSSSTAAYNSKDTFKYTTSSDVVKSHTATVAELKPTNDSKDTVEYVPVSLKTAIANNKELDAPTLTEVVSNYTLEPTNVVPLHANTMQGASRVGVANNAATAITLPKMEASPAINEQSKVLALETEPMLDTDQVSKRIKLLRWPKAEVIQRHPGNAILASMVINVPMSVEDMAKQSDLPLAICQKFIDAVLETNVAVYVDLPEVVGQPANMLSATATATATATADSTIHKEKAVTDQQEKKEKRKGILYRIRAALGLLRK